MSILLSCVLYDTLVYLLSYLLRSGTGTGMIDT